MPQYKTFTIGEQGESVSALEDAVNEWMQQESPRILFVGQTSHRELLVVSFVYESDNLRDAAVAVESAEVPDVFERNLGDADLDPTDEPDVLLPEAELPY